MTSKTCVLEAVMDISAFSSYLLLCEEMNYAAAARRCFMTRQALRQTVQALEKHYSVTLVENRMNRLYLTEAGEQLRRQAERIVAEMAVSAFRAGVNIYITYYAREIARMIREGKIG